ncbi:MAG: heme-binding protein [Rhizomicrobium sp.]
MKKLLLASAALMIAMPVVQAQPANPAPTIMSAPTPDEMKLPRPDRVKGISTALAIEAAVEANRVCLGNTYMTTTMIADSAGVPIVVISNDGAKAITQRIAMSKIQAVLKYKMTSGEVAAKANADAAFKAELAANPQIETARQGAIPIMAGAQTVGFFAVSGAPGGDKDEVCARAGLAKIQSRVQ